MNTIDIIRAEIKLCRDLYNNPNRVVHGVADAFRQDGRAAMCEDLLSFLDTLQEPIKVYRVENEKEQKGLWRKFDGTWEPLFDMLTDGQCRNMPMDDNDIYHAEGLRWFASAPSTKTLQKWFSKKDLEELTAAGFTITEFTISRYKVLSEFEYIFPRDCIIATRHLSVRDIYPDTLQESEVDLKKAAVNAYESWKGGTMDDFMRDMEALGKIVKPLRNAK